MARRPKKTVADDPVLSAEWNGPRNHPAKATGVSAMSKKPFWWRCPQGHGWRTAPANRTRSGTTCTICSSLEVVCADIASEWDCETNAPLTPRDVRPKSNKKVSWLCGAHDSHRWEAKINNRVVGGTGCPYCAGKLATSSTSLRALNPNIAAEWDSEKNGKLTPDDVRPGSNKRVSWVCSANSRHRWETTVNTRTSGIGCPYCSGRKTLPETSLLAERPELAEEWHAFRNGELTPAHVRSQSNQAVWWRCGENMTHEWRTRVAHRVNGSGCPFCSGRRASPTTSLAFLEPSLAKEWHPTQNGDLEPNEVRPGSGKNVWWRCGEDSSHAWPATPFNRVRGSGCPYCSGRRPTLGNTLGDHHCELVSEWHPSRNGELTPADVTRYSNRYVWWQCRVNQNHEWRTTVANRSFLGRGCPGCRLSRRSKQEVRLAFELAVFLPIDLDDHKVKVGDGFVDVDIISRELRLAIEFDGSYWHQGKEGRDRAKSESLSKAGWTVVRVREEPLEALSEHDVSVPLSDVHAATVGVVRRVSTVLKMELPGIAAYQEAGRTVDDAAAEEYFEELRKLQKGDE